MRWEFKSRLYMFCILLPQIYFYDVWIFFCRFWNQPGIRVWAALSNLNGLEEQRQEAQKAVMNGLDLLGRWAFPESCEIRCSTPNFKWAAVWESWHQASERVGERQDGGEDQRLSRSPWMIRLLRPLPLPSDAFCEPTEQPKCGFPASVHRQLNTKLIHWYLAERKYFLVENHGKMRYTERVWESCIRQE